MKPQIIDIPGIGPTAAAALDEHGFKSLADLARSSVEKVSTTVSSIVILRCLRSGSIGPPLIPLAR